MVGLENMDDDCKVFLVISGYTSVSLCQVLTAFIPVAGARLRLGSGSVFLGLHVPGTPPKALPP